MKTPPTKRLDPRWTRGDLAGVLALMLAAGAALACKAAAPRLALGDSVPVFSQNVANDRVNPNTASEASLRRLPGLGATRAADIVRYRQANGPTAFGRPADLERIKGIGPGTAAKIREYLDLPND